MSTHRTAAPALVATVLLLASHHAVADSNCSSSGLDQSLERTSEGINWTVRYSNEDPGDDKIFYPTADAERLRDVIDLARQRHANDWAFVWPRLDNPSFPDAADFVVKEEPGNGRFCETCLILDAKRARNRGNRSFPWVPGHELFHARQWRYLRDAGASNGFGGLGGWVIEGSARCLDDRLTSDLDEVGPFDSDTNRLFNGAPDEGAPYLERSLLDSQYLYRACLFWAYGCEQYGAPALDFEPDRGVDFVRRFWELAGEAYADDETKDSLATLGAVLEERGGPSVDEHWHRFTATMLAREFDVSTVPNASWYRFVDESDPNSFSDYEDVDREETFVGNGPFPQMDAHTVKAYGHVFYELPTPVLTSICEVVGARGSADQPVAWTLIGVKPPASAGDPERAVVISRHRGREFARSVLFSFDDPYARLGLVVAGLSDASDYTLTVDRGPVFPEIVRPTSTWPEFPGPADDPGRFLVRVRLNGPDGLKPDGVGNLSVAGLTADHFTVSVAGDEAAIISAAYVGTEYWLVVQAPTRPADGPYDLLVTLCADTIGPTTDSTSDSVVYGDVHRNHMLVLDRSYSMHEPDDGSGTKFAAAQSAVRLYVDAVSETDRIGLVRFAGDDTACTEDAATLEALAEATPAQRDDIKNDVGGLSPNGWTSIGDGLWNAQDQFDQLPIAQVQANWIVLLSDGDENEDRYWGSSISCAGDLGDNARDRLTATSTRINALAFGPESDQPLMQEIATATAGDYSYIPVAESGDKSRGTQVDGNAQAGALAEAYMRALKDARQLEQLFRHTGTIPGGPPVDLPIAVAEPGYVEGTLFAHWTNDAAGATIELRDPNDNVITASQASIYSSATHKVYHIDGELGLGGWTLRVTAGADIELHAGLLARQSDGLQLQSTVAQVNTGGAFDLTNVYGPFEWGVPVRIITMLTDANGPVLGATVTARVTLPDGTLSCPNLVLRDDGTQQDGEAGDGVYAAVYTQTHLAGLPTGVINDDPLNPHPDGETGTYRVDLAVTKTVAAGTIHRYDLRHFNVLRTQTSLDDSDFDQLPDTWEAYYGTDPLVDDSQVDGDDDGLVHLDEFLNGTHPFDDDTDNGGEQDGSEVSAGLCPLDPADDRLPAPRTFAVEDRIGDTDASVLQSLALRLIFPVHPSYLEMEIFRSPTPNPADFQLITTLDRDGLRDAVHYDPGLTNGQTYYYRGRARGASGAVSRFSRIAAGTAWENPVPPEGYVLINHDSAYTDTDAALLTLGFSDGVTQYRVSNDRIGSGALPPWQPVPANGEVPWQLDLPGSGERTRVYVQYMKSTTDPLSPVVVDEIRYDPQGNFDNDAFANLGDFDDDNDGLLDGDEVFVHGTDPYNPDSDFDGLLDGNEVNGGCTSPRDPDHDRDGLIDGADPSRSGDADGDRDVDLDDIEQLQLCMGQAPVGDCVCLDFDGSGVVDSADFTAHASNITGPLD